MKATTTILFLLIALTQVNAQLAGGTLLPTGKYQQFNKSAIAMGKKVLDAKYSYYDTVNYVSRPFTSITEANTFLPVTNRGMGQTVLINTGGTVNSSGSVTVSGITYAKGEIIGGVNDEYWYRNNSSNSGLVLKTGGSNSETDPTVSAAAKSISSTDIASWNEKQAALSTGSGVYMSGSKIIARKDSALWNAASLNGNAISTTTPTVGQVLKWNGTQWAPAPCDCDAQVNFAITSQPSSQTVAEGSAYSFSVNVTGGTAPYVYNWFKGSVSMGVNSNTLSGTAALSDDADYHPTITDATNTTLVGTTVHLTVSSPPVITYGYSTTDPYVDNSTIPTISNSATLTISPGANLSIPYTSAAVDKFLVIKIPSSQPTPTAWYSTAFNNGTIPDATFRAVFTIGSFKYLVSRDLAGVAFDPTVPMQFNH